MADEIILHPFNKIDEPDWIALHTKGKIQREAGHRGFQDMELRADGRSFLRVTTGGAGIALSYGCFSPCRRSAAHPCKARQRTGIGIPALAARAYAKCRISGIRGVSPKRLYILEGASAVSR